MKYSVVAILSLICILSTSLVWAGQCDDIKLTGVVVRDLGRLGVYEIFVANRSEHPTLAFIISLEHKTWYKKTIDVDFKVVRGRVEPGTFTSLKFVAPMPGGTSATTLGLECVVILYQGKERRVLECVEGRNLNGNQ